jgi:hypothetical protein
MGVMPSAQFGSVATVSIVNNAGSTYNNSLLLRNISTSSVISSAANTSNPLILKANSGPVSVDEILGVNISGLISSFDILSFRIAEATQKWKEV